MNEPDQELVLRVAAVLGAVGVEEQDEPEIYRLGSGGDPERLSWNLVRSELVRARDEHEHPLRKAS